MLFALILKPNDLTYTYGRIPNIPLSTNDAAEVLHFDLPEDLSVEDFCAQFVDPVASLCNAALDYGDIDLLDLNACASLIAWIPKHQANGNLSPWICELYGKLLEYAKRAVKLETGVVIEL